MAANAPVIILDDSDDEPQATRSTPCPQSWQTSQPAYLANRDSFGSSPGGRFAEEAIQIHGITPNINRLDDVPLSAIPQYVPPGQAANFIEMGQNEQNAHASVHLVVPPNIANTPLTIRFFNDMAYQIVTTFPYQEFARSHGCSPEDVRRALMDYAIRPFLAGARIKQAQAVAYGYNGAVMQRYANIMPSSIRHMRPVDPRLVDPQLMATGTNDLGNVVRASSTTSAVVQASVIIQQQSRQTNEASTTQTASKKRQRDQAESCPTEVPETANSAQPELSSKKLKAGSATISLGATSSQSAPAAPPKSAENASSRPCGISNSSVASAPGAAAIEYRSLTVSKEGPRRYPEISQRRRVVVDEFGSYVDSRSSEDPKCDSQNTSSAGEATYGTVFQHLPEESPRCVKPRGKSLYAVATQKDREVWEKHLRDPCSRMRQQPQLMQEQTTVVGGDDEEAEIAGTFDWLE